MLNALLDIIYPVRCVSCKNSLHNYSDGPLCADCFQEIEMNMPPFCQKCGRHLELDKDLNKEICAECKNKNLHFDRAWSVCNYNVKMKELLHLFKYNNKIVLKKPLTRLLVKFIQNFNIAVERFDFIIPIPLHPTRLREREYNQTQLLTEELSKALSLKISQDNLLRIRNTAPQSSLNANSRWDNIKGAFRVKDPKQVEEKDVLIVDDLYTTGATASEVALTLKNAGAREVCVLTLAIAK